MTQPTRILIFGTGGVGSIYAYLLQKGGAEVTTVCRTNYEAVKERGIGISSPIFGNVHFNPTQVVKSVSEAASLLTPPEAYDFVLVASKAFPGTSEKIKDVVAPGKTAIVLAQNGILIEEEYLIRYPENPVISGVVYLPTTQVSPGIIDMGPLELFEIVV
jgi:2-dehydropantoate 2-reductase